MSEPWQMKVERGLAAHFTDTEGASRPGVQWVITLKRGDKTFVALVKALMADDATAETKADREYQASVALQYLNERLNAGWTPDQQMDHLIYVSNRKEKRH